MKNLFLLLTLTTLGTAVAATRVGNNGDAVSLDFARHGASAISLARTLPALGIPAAELDELTNLLPQIRIESEEKLESIGTDGRLRERDAMNQPAEQRILVSRSRWAVLRTSERLALAFHELLGLSGHERNTFGYSAHFANELNRLAAATPTEPVILFRETFPSPTEGLSYADASQICSREKARHAKLYFFVYCVYREKNSIVPWGPYDAFLVTNYDLEVFGLGRLNQLYWKQLYSSLRAGGERRLTFATSASARLQCQRQLIESHNRDAHRFERAECEVFPLDGRYAFEIRTLNPFVIVE